MNIRQDLKKYLFLYKLVYRYRRFWQNRQINNEQRFFEKLAGAQRISFNEESSAAVFEILKKRLAKRKIIWPPEPKSRPLHIVYVSVPGNWERHNIPPELSKLGEVTCFFLDEQGMPLDLGWEAVRRDVDLRLPSYINKLHQEKPIDMMLSYLSGSQISPHTIRQINTLGIPTFSFHWDDRRSFKGLKYGKQWSGPFAVCKAYDLNLTNSPKSLIKYRAEEANALFWPEGANPDFFRPLDIPFEYDVTFCGQRYGQRPLLVDYLRRHGIRVDCFGREWEHGYQSDEALVQIFNQSRINLGFGYVNESTEQCLKGRDFEIPACGAVYLTSYNRDLERVYRLGEEIETYVDYDSCTQKIKALLDQPERCERMRYAARQAVLTRHTWSQRVYQLLSCAGQHPVKRQ
jgi:glycosyltransferase involved in cell wall biosynthesis